jgi:hypothetical protein
MEVVPLNLVCEFLTLARFCSSPGFVLPGFLVRCAWFLSFPGLFLFAEL